MNQFFLLVLQWAQVARESPPLVLRSHYCWVCELRIDEDHGSLLRAAPPMQFAADGLLGSLARASSWAEAETGLGRLDWPSLFTYLIEEDHWPLHARLEELFSEPELVAHPNAPFCHPDWSPANSTATIGARLVLR